MSGAMCWQPLVPVIDAEDGRWIITAPLALLCKPGGHGVIWKLAYDKGIYGWFKDHGRKGATVRQVRLPLLILSFHFPCLSVAKDLMYYIIAI